MDAKDITPERLAHAMRECMKLHENPEMDERLGSMAASLLSDDECRYLTSSLQQAMVSLTVRTPQLFFPILLGMGIMIGVNMAKQVEELRSLEMLT